MNLARKITDFFPKIGEIFIINEKYSSFELEYNTTIPDNLTHEQLVKLKNIISRKDKFSLEIIVENDDPITLEDKTFDTGFFLRKLEEANKYIEDGENVKIKLSIHKQTKNSIVHIYDFESFIKFSKSISVMNWLDIINDDLKRNNVLKFKVLEENFEPFWSNNIIFSNTDRPANESSNETTSIQVNENCHFSNYEQYPYNPTYFQLLKIPRIENAITTILDQLSFIFSITSIFDITSINDDILFYKINGYKTIEGQFNINNEIVNYKDSYVKIFKWIYSEQANSTDKIGLSRNILSIYLKDESLSIDDSVYFSIQSGFKTYLQDNINKYIDIRNKISDQLVEISNRAIKISENYLAYYQKSNIAFVSFFISVFTIRALVTKNFTNIFSKETTIIAMSILLISFLYMIVSVIGINSDIERLKLKYKNIKNRFKDLLIDDDINKILRDDQEFNDEIIYIKKRRFIYTTLWVLTIFIFTLTVIFLSSYIKLSEYMK